MAGLMNPGGGKNREKQQPNAEEALAGMTGPQPGAPAPGPEGPQGGEEGNVSPEEQAQYDQFVKNGMQLIYQKEGLEQLFTTLEGDGNPIQGVADTLVMVVSRLEDSAEEKGVEVSGDVKMHGAQELLEQLVELSENASIHEFSDEEMEQAFYLALDEYRIKKQRSGTLPVDELQEDFQALAQAEEQGQLDEVLPGVSEFAQRAPSPEDLAKKGGKGDKGKSGRAA